MHICILFCALLSGAIYSKAVNRFEDVGWKDKEQENSPELPYLKSCHFPSWQPVPNKLLISIYWCTRVASALVLWLWMQLTQTLYFSQALSLTSLLPPCLFVAIQKTWILWIASLKWLIIGIIIIIFGMIPLCQVKQWKAMAKRARRCKTKTKVETYIKIFALTNRIKAS